MSTFRFPAPSSLSRLPIRAAFALFALAVAVALLAACGSPQVVEEGDNVAVHYHGTLDDGEVFDSSLERDPLEFEVGGGQMIAGFDEAVRGLAVGEIRTVRIEPADAYGERREDLVLEFPASEAPDGIEVGSQVSISGTPAVVVEITDDVVVVDANHRLAGQALTFEIELVSIE